MASWIVASGSSKPKYRPMLGAERFASTVSALPPNIGERPMAAFITVVVLPTPPLQEKKPIMRDCLPPPRLPLFRLGSDRGSWPPDRSLLIFGIVDILGI